MGSFSVWHWLIVIFFWIIVFGWPLVKVIRKAGFSGWWVVLAFLPIINIIALWVFAFVSWPNQSRRP